MKLFISYCDADQRFKDEFVIHLNPLISDRTHIVWDSGHLLAGDESRTVIERVLSETIFLEGRKRWG